MEAKEEEAVKPKNKGGRPPKSKRKLRVNGPPTLRQRLDAIKMRERMKDPAFRKMKRATARNASQAAAAKNATRIGIPDGWTRDRVDMQRVYDGIKADLLIDRMKAEGMVDETKPGDFEVIYVDVAGKKVEVRVPKTKAGMAEAALREAVIGALSPLTHAAAKPNYIKTVLDWTMAKPAQTSNVNVSSKDWLDAAMQDNSTYDDGDDEGAIEAP